MTCRKPALRADQVLGSVKLDHPELSGRAVCSDRAHSNTFRLTRPMAILPSGSCGHGAASALSDRTASFGKPEKSRKKIDARAKMRYNQSHMDQE